MLLYTLYGNVTLPNFIVITRKYQTEIMAKMSNTVATLLAGVAVGVAVGYLLATDKDKRREDMAKLKKGLDNIKDKFGKMPADVEENIYT